MEMIRVTAIVLRSVPYKERDRLLTLYSASNGKITVTARGTESPKSKLYVGAREKCLAEYELTVGKNGNYSMTGVKVIDTFFALSHSVDSYYAAEIITELFDKTTVEGAADNRYFAEYLNALKGLAYGGGDSADIINSFFLNVMLSNGFDLNFDKACSMCGNNMFTFAFSNTKCAFVCEGCRRLCESDNYAYFSPSGVSYVNALLRGEDTSPYTDKATVMNTLYAMLSSYLRVHIQSYGEYAKLCEV